MRNIFSAVVGLLVVDLRGCIVDLNRAAEQMLESTAHSAIGSRFVIFLSAKTAWRQVVEMDIIVRYVQ